MNRTRRLLIAAVMAVVTATGADGAAVSAHTVSPPVTITSTYTVRPGDNLVGIAQRLGVRLRALLEANELTLTSFIHPGDVLEIPAGASVSPTSPPNPKAATIAYIVKPGDALASIATGHGVKLTALLKANTLTVTSSIHPGQTLQIPPATLPIPTAPAPVSPPTSPGVVAPAPSGTPVETVVAYLRAQVGKPYKFFTAGPDTVDCSGLVVAGYRQIGVVLPHQSGALSELGTAIDQTTTTISAGDLVFTVSSSDPTQIGHVGIALNSTTWIQAAGTGIPVRIRPLPAPDRIAAVRRIIQPDQ